MGSEIAIGVAMRRGFPSERASGLAGQQFGAISRRQLLAVGFSPSRVDRWLRGGRLHRRYPGVFALGRPDLLPAGQLAAGLLHAGSGAALGSISALWWMELLHRRPTAIAIVVPGHSRSRQDLRICHPARVTRQWHRGLPVVTLPEALLAASADLSHNSLRLVLARADFKQMLSLPALNVALADGRRGSTAVGAAMDAHLPQLARCANRFERDFVLLCEGARLPLPEPNPRIGRWRPDMLWRNERLIVELDGRDAHSSQAQLAADARRQAELEALGYTVLRFTWAEVRLEAERVAVVVRRHLSSPGAPSST